MVQFSVYGKTRIFQPLCKCIYGVVGVTRISEFDTQEFINKVKLYHYVCLFTLNHRTCNKIVVFLSGTVVVYQFLMHMAVIHIYQMIICYPQFVFMNTTNIMVRVRITFGRRPYHVQRKLLIFFMYHVSCIA